MLEVRSKSITEKEGDAPSFCRTWDHDDKASGLKIVDRKSTDLSFGTAIPNHSGPTRRIVLSAAYSICFETTGDSGRSVLMDSNRRLSAMFIREIKALTPKPFAINLWVSMEDEGALTATEEAFNRSLLLWQTY